MCLRQDRRLCPFLTLAHPMHYLPSGYSLLPTSTALSSKCLAQSTGALNQVWTPDSWGKRRMPGAIFPPVLCSQPLAKGELGRKQDHPRELREKPSRSHGPPASFIRRNLRSREPTASPGSHSEPASEPGESRCPVFQ